MTPEAKVKSKIKAALKRVAEDRGESVYVCMPIGTRYGYNGDPDFLCCVSGRMVGIEAKADGQLPGKVQTQRLVGISNSGGVALVIDKNNVGQLEQMIREYVDEGRTEPQDYLERAIAHWAARAEVASAGDEDLGVSVRGAEPVSGAGERSREPRGKGSRHHPAPVCSYGRSGSPRELALRAVECAAVRGKEGASMARH